MTKKKETSEDELEVTHLDLPASAELPEGVPEGILQLSPDIAVPLIIVMGRKRVTVKDLLELRSGQILEMERTPTEPVEVVAAGKTIAKGELVDVDGKLGIRILQLLK